MILKENVWWTRLMVIAEKVARGLPLHYQQRQMQARWQGSWLPSLCLKLTSKHFPSSHIRMFMLLHSSVACLETQSFNLYS